MMKPEVLAWVEFYKQNPFDDYHRFYRPAAFVANAFSGRDINESLAWFEKRPIAAEAVGYSAADARTMEAFGMKPPKKDD